ncbi:MAG TPA: hypothetical protein DDY49_15435 [Paenibacillaceae bacterium]|nr:hypothetical protein [Paenibacillaceae bacterium]
MKYKTILIVIIVLLLIPLFYFINNWNKNTSYLVTALSDSFELDNGKLERTDGRGFDWILTGTIIPKEGIDWDSYDCTLFLPSPLHSTFEAKGKGQAILDYGLELTVPIYNSKSINKNEIKSLINKSYFKINYLLNKKTFEEKIELHIK